MYFVTPPASEALTKDFILSKIPQEQIFEHYLGVKVQTRKQFRNPMRKDRHPSMRFFYRKGTGELICRDYAGYFWGDCFNVVEYTKGISGLMNVLEHIANTFHLRDNDPIPAIPPRSYQHLAEDKERGTKYGYSIIEVSYRRPTDQDKGFWEERGVLPEQLQAFGVYTIDMTWINGRIVYRHKKSDPCYGYYFGDGQWKLYFPLRKKDQTRFYSNTNRTQGWNQLPKKGVFAIITKSHKDVMVLSRLGIPAVASQGESIFLPEDQINELKKRFQFVFSLMDFDRTGIHAAWKMRKDHGIEPFFLTNGRFNTPDYGAKDISDYAYNFRIETASWLIQQVYSSVVRSAGGLSAVSRDSLKRKAKVLPSGRQTAEKLLPKEWLPF